MTPEKELESVEKKLAIYKEALEDTVRKLTQARTDLATQARKTVEDLEANIPELRSKVSELSDKISELDKAIIRKTAELNRQREDFAKRYQSDKEVLDKEHQKRTDEIAKEKEKVNEQRKEAIGLFENIKARESQLEIDNAELGRAKMRLKSDISVFQSERELALNEIAKMKEKAEIVLADAKKKQAEAIKTNEDLAFKLKRLAEDKKATEGILERIDEAEGILEEARKVSRENARITEENNVIAIQNKADARKNAIRTQLLDEREESLNKRDSNLKILEAK